MKIAYSRIENIFIAAILFSLLSLFLPLINPYNVYSLIHVPDFYTVKLGQKGISVVLFWCKTWIVGTR